MTSATNDNFLHLTLAKQWLAGDWPVRDFFDQASILQFAISAVAQAIGGDRLISEAVVVGLAWAVSTYLVFQLVRRLTGYPVVAALAAVLLIAAGARGILLPERHHLRCCRGVVVAVRRGANDQTNRASWHVGSGGLLLASRSRGLCRPRGAARLSRRSWSETSDCQAVLAAAATTLALLAPFLVYVQATLGLRQYVQTWGCRGPDGACDAGTSRVATASVSGTSAVVIEPAESYAPTIGVRWTPESLGGPAAQLLARYDLTLVESDDAAVDRVRLSARSVANLRARQRADRCGHRRRRSFECHAVAASWATLQRWKFNHAWLRVRILPALDSQARASEIAVALFYALPIAMIVAAPWLARYLSGLNAVQLAGFASWALIVDAAMLRLPFPARMADAVVLSAIVFGCCVAGSGERLRCRGGSSRPLWVWLPRPHNRRGPDRAPSPAGLAIGSPTSPAAGLAHARTGSIERRLRGAHRSPPLSYFVDKRARFSLHLAAYVRDCVPRDRTMLVFWFEPEIYYYGDRLMAQRHLVFAPTWANVAHEQTMTLERINRFAPPIALARRSALDGYARASYPGVVDYLQREYRQAVTVTDDGEEYLIFARRSRPEFSGLALETGPASCVRPHPGPG